MLKFGDVVSIQHLDVRFHICVTEPCEDPDYVKGLTWIPDGENEGLQWVEKIRTKICKKESYFDGSDRDPIEVGSKVRLRGIPTSPTFIANETIYVSAKEFEVVWVTHRFGVQILKIPGIALIAIAANG